MFVIKSGRKYVRFGSYSSVTLVDNAWQASLYSRVADMMGRPYTGPVLEIFEV